MYVLRRTEKTAMRTQSWLRLPRKPNKNCRRNRTLKTPTWVDWKTTNCLKLSEWHRTSFYVTALRPVHTSNATSWKQSATCCSRLVAPCPCLTCSIEVVTENWTLSKGRTWADRLVAKTARLVRLDAFDMSLVCKVKWIKCLLPLTISCSSESRLFLPR